MSQVAQMNPYEGLSESAREQCIKRMVRTLSRKPRSKNTRDYVKSLDGRPETEAELRARSISAAERVIENAVAAAGAAPPVLIKARKSRVSPFARKSEQPHPLKRCRRASRHQRYISGGAREPRGLEEMRLARRVLYEAQAGICGICGCDLNPDPHRNSLDHVIPHALGGPNGLGNFLLAHGECNGDKTNDAPTGCEMVMLIAVNCRLGLKPDRY